MRNYVLLLVYLFCIWSCSQPEKVDEIAPTDFRIAAENSFFYLAEEMKSIYLEHHPDAAFEILYGTPSEIQKRFVEEGVNLLISSNPLYSNAQTYFDTSGIVIVDEEIGRESLWYFGPYYQRDSIICTPEIKQRLNQTRLRKSAFLFSGYIAQPLGLFESMTAEQANADEFIPIAFPAFDHLDSLFRQFPESWGVVGSSQWLLAPSSEKNDFANCCRWKRIRPCGENGIADKLRFRTIHLMSRSERGADFIEFWKGAVGQVWLRRSGIKTDQIN